MNKSYLRESSLYIFSFFLCLVGHVQAQNTVGTVYQDSTLQDGYTLIFPEYQPDVFLIDPCGQIVNTWEGEEGTAPGFSVYLDSEGNLIKSLRPEMDPDSTFVSASGQSGLVEILDWDNNLIWSYEQIQGNRRLHHDIEPLPNGNILMLAWEIISLDDAYALGRDPETLISNNLYDEVIYEVDPSTDEIVWEWKASDHLIQTFNTIGPNWVGNPSAWSQRIDLNYVGDSNRKNDWLHINSIDYNEELDQIMISVPSFSEVWIIDHSTTTAEAAGTSGGRSNKGGDLLYRWGNPQAYNAGDESDQKFFYQHAAQWVSEQLSDKSQRKGEVIVFNNRQDNFSTVEIFSLSTFDSISWTYMKDSEPYGPLEVDRVVQHPANPNALYSTIMSSGQVLDNGNVLINATLPGTIVEITPEDTIAWEYVVPLTLGERLEQYASPTIGGSLIFKSEKFPLTFPGFENKDLSPTGYLELNPDTTLCGSMMIDTMMMDTMVMDTMMMDTMVMDTMVMDTMDVSTIDIALLNKVDLLPNPASDYFHIDWPLRSTSYEIYSVNGKSVKSAIVNQGINKVSIQELNPGIYFIRFGEYGAKRFIKR